MTDAVQNLTAKYVFYSPTSDTVYKLTVQTQRLQQTKYPQGTSTCEGYPVVGGTLITLSSTGAVTTYQIPSGIVGYNVQALYPNASLPPNGMGPAANVNSIFGIQQLCVQGAASSIWPGITASAVGTPDQFLFQVVQGQNDTANLYWAQFPPA